MTEPRIDTEADWRVLESLKLRNLTALKGITEQVNAQIIRELSDGINAGESIPKLTKRLQDSVAMGKQRATTMARTETINACVDGARVRYEQYGVKEFQYIAASDSRTCKQCAELDGKVFKMGDNAHMPPLHPNCRCCIAAVIPKRGDTPKPTSREKPNESLVPFTDLTDLTHEEKQALRYYQDIGNPQHNWDVEIPKDEPHKDCYVINNALRDAEFRNSLSSHDVKLATSLTVLLDNAIEKSVTVQKTSLVKGLDNADWIRSKKVGEYYVDDGFGSYAVAKEHALKYAKIQSDGSRVFIYRDIEKNKHAVYMGDTEGEMLLPRSRKYVIARISRVERGEIFDDSDTIIYYVSEI